MTEDSFAAGGRRSPDSYRQQIEHALDHAEDLIASADRVLGDDNNHANIAYHLAILALEEIGRAGILAQVMVASRAGANRMERRLDDHVFKLMHAVWSTSMDGGKIDPKDWESARAFALSTHARRMAGLYTDFDEDDGTSAPPRDAVLLGHATSVLNLARARLEYYRARGIPTGESTEELDWYLDTVSDELGRRRLFSPPFIEKYEELEGDTPAWVKWAREEFLRISAEEQALLQRELTRQVNEEGEAQEKWKLKIRLHTASHSVRASALAYWNERIEGTKFFAVGNNKQELLMEMMLGDRITLDHLFDAGMSLSKIHIVALNVGSAGFFWFELTSQAQQYYESLVDISAPTHRILVGRNRGLPKEWSDPEGKRRYVALEDSHMENAIRFIAAFASLPEEEAGPIFGPYLRGMTLLAKTDIHLSFEQLAQQDFLEVLRRALTRFGDWDGDEATFLPALHSVLSEFVPEKQDREMLFQHLRRADASENELLSDAVNTKRVADLYLNVVARRQWPEFVKRAAGRRTMPLASAVENERPGDTATGGSEA